MAKFGRFDPRNKKQDRNKQKSLYKDIRIHENDKDRYRGNIYHEVIFDELVTFEKRFDDEDESV